MVKDTKEVIRPEDVEDIRENPRNTLTIQQFMNDMRMLGEQVNDKDLVKPGSFNYGDGSITNYLLWLMLGELMRLNDDMEEED